MFGGLSRSGGEGRPQRETSAHASLPGRNSRHEASAVSLCVCVCVCVCVCEYLHSGMNMICPTENENKAICMSF